MGVFFRLFWSWLVDSFYVFFDLLVINLLWLVSCLPLVTAPSATLALFYAANQAARGLPGGWGAFWHGFRRDFRLSLRWGLLNAALLLVLASNVIFYGRFEETIGSLARWGQGFFASLVWVWGLVQLYALPLLMEQDDRRLRLALRNSLVLVGRNPGFTLAFGLTVGLVVVLVSLFAGPPWLVIGAGLGAYLSNRAVRHLLGLPPPG